VQPTPYRISEGASSPSLRASSPPANQALSGGSGGFPPGSIKKYRYCTHHPGGGPSLPGRRALLTRQADSPYPTGGRLVLLPYRPGGGYSFLGRRILLPWKADTPCPEGGYSLPGRRILLARKADTPAYSRKGILRNITRCLGSAGITRSAGVIGAFCLTQVPCFAARRPGPKSKIRRKIPRHLDGAGRAPPPPSSAPASARSRSVCLLPSLVTEPPARSPMPSSPEHPSSRGGSSAAAASSSEQQPAAAMPFVYMQ
jgi:hypothetical protein